MPIAPAIQQRRGWPAYYTVVLLLFAALFISYIDRTNISVAAIAMQEQLGWNETDKGAVLSAFFVGYLLLMAPSGALANRYGGRIVLGLAVVWWSLFTILTPPAALLSLPALVAARIALGLGEAAVFPASINLIGRHVPADRRSRATTLFASAIYLGTVFSLPVTGWLIRTWDWHMPFYVFGVAGLIWAIAWFWRVREGTAASAAPTQQATPTAANRPIPWRRLLGAPAVWAIIVAHFCGNWMLYLLLAWLPSYFKATFGVSLTGAGLLAAAPWLTSFITGNLAGVAADALLKAGRSAGFVRKLMQTLGLGGAAVCLLHLPGAATPTEAVLYMCATTGCGGLCLAGFAPNCFDVAPKYADVIWGISNTAATLPGVVGVYVTGWLVDQTGSYAAPFKLTAAVLAFGTVFYLVFGSGRQQVD